MHMYRCSRVQYVRRIFVSARTVKSVLTETEIAGGKKR